VSRNWRRWLRECSFFGLTLWLFSTYQIHNAEGAEWKLFRALPTGDIYYFDSTSIKRFPKGVVWVWVRIVETTRINEEKLKESKGPKRTKEAIEQARHESTGEWRNLFEINCPSGMVRMLSATSYDTQGRIRDDDKDPAEWVYLSSNAVTNDLTQIVCAQKAGF